MMHTYGDRFVSRILSSTTNQTTVENQIGHHGQFQIINPVTGREMGNTTLLTSDPEFERLVVNEHGDYDSVLNILKDLPDFTIAWGYGLNSTPVKGAGVETGIVITTANHAELPDIGVYSTITKTVGFGAGVGGGFSAVVGGT